MIKLGMKVKDKITGFTGITVGYDKYIDGRFRFCVQPLVDSNNTMRDAQWIDHSFLIQLKDDNHPLGFCQEVEEMEVAK